ncbi:MAG TPA: DUF6231 family protein [Gammaproteobacteria bacterium]|nr:DUF6231 family protein [Gammaproteobacteria bacterium]
MPTLWQTDFVRLVAETRPHTLLVIGPDAGALADRVRAHVGDMATLDPEEALEALSGLARYRLVWVYGTLERLAKERANVLMGGLRDLHAQRLYVLVPIGGRRGDERSHWRETDLLALGLSRSQRYSQAGRNLDLYGFDLFDYKQTPDWFSARHWANPQLWDQYRW